MWNADNFPSTNDDEPKQKFNKLGIIQRVQGMFVDAKTFHTKHVINYATTP